MDSSFAERIRERYPEGLTGIFAVGGTRTTYILEQSRDKNNPGHIKDFATYVDYAFDRLTNLVGMFFNLGGQNALIPIFPGGVVTRGPEYAQEAARMCLRVIAPPQLEFYENYQVDPYFAGIDTLLQLPEGRLERDIGVQIAEFQQNWHYVEGRRKLIWEVASIPLYSIWQAHQVMGEAAMSQLEAELLAVTDLQTVANLLYRYYARAVYGTDIPSPHFYLGSNRNGEIRLRPHLPFALLSGEPIRMFFTPYPSLFITSETLQAILEDLAFGKPLTSRRKIDYSEQLTPELAEKEYQRVMELAADPRSTLGLIRQVQPTQED